MVSSVMAEKQRNSNTDEQNIAPDNRSVLEDSMCCPEDPSTLNASIIFGVFLQIPQTHHEQKTCTKMHPLPITTFPVNKLH